jgi:hypothetical protein
MRTTEFASALAVEPTAAEPTSPCEPTTATVPASAEEQADPVTYGSPQLARSSWTSGFPGSAFTLQSDGTLRYPADRPLYPQERR